MVDPKTWAALGGDAAEPPTLANGSSGSVVEKLQTALNKGRGTLAPSTNPVLTVDGKYGPQTQTAVEGARKGSRKSVWAAWWAWRPGPSRCTRAGEALANLSSMHARHAAADPAPPGLAEQLERLGVLIIVCENCRYGDSFRGRGEGTATLSLPDPPGG